METWRVPKKGSSIRWVLWLLVDSLYKADGNKFGDQCDDKKHFFDNRRPKFIFC